MGKIRELYQKLKQAIENMSGSEETINIDLRQQEGESFEQWAVRLNEEKANCEAKIDAYKKSESANLLMVGSTPETIGLDTAYYQFKREAAEERKQLIEKILAELGKQNEAEQAEPNA